MCEIIHRWQMGDIFRTRGDEDYILARTINYKDTNLLHFQFIGKSFGNRYSDSVITHRIGIDDVIQLEEHEIAYLLEFPYDEETKRIIRKAHVRFPENN